MKVRPWDHVAKGETLAALESGDLSRAVADYHKALADDQVKQKAARRARRIFSTTTRSPNSDYQQAQGDAEAPRPSSPLRANRFASSAWIPIMPRRSSRSRLRAPG